MNISVFLAKTLGLYIVIASIALLCKRKHFQNIIKDVTHNDALIFISGILALIVGIMLVISHNLWQNDWRVVITLLAWLIFLKGIMRIFFPNSVSKMAKKFTKNDKLYYLTAIISLLVGAFLCYHGFF